ncbi:MAG: T9SS type A sorting domain-containing protein [Bacteroidota bacterium]
MKRNLHILLLLSTIFLPASLMSQTMVSGNISTNTTWNMAGSPYIVTADVIVDPMVILTIRPGVVVRFDAGTRMGVRGFLRAVGQDTARIRFTANDTSATAGFWKGIVVSGATRMENVVGTYAKKFLFLYDGGTNLSQVKGSIFSQNDTAMVFDGSYPDSLHVWRCLFEKNRIGMIADSTASVRWSIFKENDWGILGNRIIVARNKFIDNGYGAILERSGVVRNTFSGNTVAGLTEARCRVGFNRIDHNDIGIRSNLLPGSIMKFNHLRANRVGLRIGAAAGSSATGQTQGIFRRNSICNSWLYNAANFSDSTVTIDLEQNCWCDSDSAAVAATIFDGNDTSAVGFVDFLPMDTTFCEPDRVYPGDANYNGIANIFDIFPIGLKFGSTGPTRPNATVQWVGQPAPDWNDTLPNGVNIKHTDCNGDGVINLQDIGPIILNYGNTHNSNKTTVTDGIPLSISLPTTVNEGDTISFPINFGTSLFPAQNVYGIAFSVAYDTSLVKPGTFSIDFSNSWMGTQGTDLIGFAHDIYQDGTLDIGLVRTNQTPMSGSGLLADVTVVIDEDIAKTFIPLTFEFLESRAIDAVNEDVPVTGYNSESEVSTTSISDEVLSTFSFYPNPVEDILTVEHGHIEIRELRITTLAGQTLLTKNTQNVAKSEISLSKYPNGMYFLTVLTDEGKHTEKIYIVR